MALLDAAPPMVQQPSDFDHSLEITDKSLPQTLLHFFSDQQFILLVMPCTTGFVDLHLAVPLVSDFATSHAGEASRFAPATRHQDYKYHNIRCGLRQILNQRTLSNFFTQPNHLRVSPPLTLISRYDSQSSPEQPFHDPGRNQQGGPGGHEPRQALPQVPAARLPPVPLRVLQPRLLFPAQIARSPQLRWKTQHTHKRT